MTDRMTEAAWFVPLTDPAGEEARIVAVPQAGGGCATFAPVADRLGPRVGLWGANFPGRQARFLEPACTDREVVLDRLADDWPDSGRTVLFGYCSGALLAFLLARRLRDLGRPLPAALVVASYPAPDLARPPRDLHSAEPDRFWSQVLGLGGVPAPVVEQPDFREIFEVALRADYALLADYAYAPAPPLDLPLVALHGDRDPTLGPDLVAAWSRHTTGPFRLECVPGDHWLLETALARTGDVLLEAATGAPAR